MVQFNFAERTIKAKVVYYGPPQSGKTTNLEQIHRLTDPAGSTRLVSLNTGQDRTLFFDLLPFSLGSVAGYDFKLQLYTVPGQVQYNATRRVVLSSADAVVFVADSRRSMLNENLGSFENMKVNLLANRLVPEKVPLVLQYNKRDLPDLLSPPELDAALNLWGRPTFPAVAASGEGVMEAFCAVVQQMLTSIAIKYDLRQRGLDPAAVPDIVSEAFAGVLRQASRTAAEAASPPSPGRLVVAQAEEPPSPGSEAPLQESEELLRRAIRTGAALAESLAGLVREMSLGLASIQSHAELALMYRDEARDKRASALRSIQEEAARLRGIVQQLGRTGGPEGEEDQDQPAAPPGSLDPLLRSLVARLGEKTGGVVSVELRVAPGLGVPRCPSAELEGALGTLLEGVVASAPPRSALTLQAERKPVVLRGREGDQRRDFLMLALRQAGGPSPEEQNRIAAGDPALLGGSPRRVRELGGFIRFAPLAGGVEMRVFLPAG